MATKTRRINWLNVSTVASATILIGAEVFGAAFAASWAITTLAGFGQTTAIALDVILFACGAAVMVGFVRGANRVEPYAE